MHQAERTAPWRWIGAAVLAGLAAVPRVVRPDLVEYKFDEATVVLNARAIVEDHILPLHGQASSAAGLWHSPLLYYLMAPFLAVSWDPRLAVMAIGLANALAVGLAWVVVSRAFGPRVGLISALLFASGSWAIIFSRKIWSIDLLPPLAVVALWGLLRTVDERIDHPGLGRSWLALALMTALNDSAWPLALVVGLVQLLAPRSRTGRALRWSLAGAMAFIGPALVLVPRLLPLLGRAIRRGGEGAAGPIIDLSPLASLVQLGDSTGFQVLAGPTTQFAQQAALAGWLAPALQLLVIVGAIVAGTRVIREWLRARRPALSPELIILAWWLAPGVIALHPITPIYFHHFVDTLPTQFILIALAIDRAIEGVEAAIGHAGARASWLPASLWSVLTGAIALTQLGTFAAYLPYVRVHAADTFFGVPLGQHQRAIEAAKSAASGSVIVLAGDGDTVGVDELPTILASLAPRDSLQIVDLDESLVFPERGEASLLIAPDAINRFNVALAPWRAPAGPVEEDEIALPGGYQRVTTRAPGAWLPAEWHHLEVMLEDQGVVVGYDAPRQIQPGQPIEVQVAWRIGQPAAEPSRQSVFAHVVDDRGQSHAGQDFAPMPSTSWRKGETVVNRFALTAPPNLEPGRYWVDFGRYQRPQVQPVRVVSNGTPGPASVRLGPLAVPPREQAVARLASVSADFNGEIRLTGWKASQEGTNLSVVLAWQAVKAPRESYTVFLHLITPTGAIVTQNDSEPRSGQFPTSTWIPGQRVIDPHLLPLANVRGGTYRLEVGLYTPANGRRLPVGRGESVLLGSIEIAGQPTVPAAPTAPAAHPSPSATPAHLPTPPPPSRTPTPTNPSLTPTPTGRPLSPTISPTPRLTISR